MYNISKRLTKYNLTDKNNTNSIKYIVVHYFGGTGTAANVAGWFQNPNAKASAHYNLDENPDIYQSVEDEDIAWHCGTSGMTRCCCIALASD